MFDIDKSSIYSIHNWIPEMGIWCLDSFRMGLFGGLIFIAYGVFSMFNYIADSIGRKKYLLIFLIVSLITQLLMMSISNTVARYFFMFMVGATRCGTPIAFMLLVENTG